MVRTLGAVSLIATGAAAAALLALIACQVPRRDGSSLIRVPGPLLVIGEIVLFAAAAWAVWPAPPAFGVIALIAADILARVPTWSRLVNESPDRVGRITARVAAAATATAVFAGVLSPWYWSPAAGATLCPRPTVQQGADDTWPDARPLDQRDAGHEDSPMLDAAEEFEGNAAFGKAAWWVPHWGEVATGNSTSVVMVDVDGLGVYDAAGGQVQWTLEAGIDEAFGRTGDDGERRIHGDRVHALGETLLVRLNHDQGRGRLGLSRDALLAVDMQTGDRLWCATGLTNIDVDLSTPDRVAVFDTAWSLLDIADGRTAGTFDVDSTPLADVTLVEPRGVLSLSADTPTEQAVLGAGRLVLTRGPAIAVYDSVDARLIHEATLPAPRANADGDAHAVYNVIVDETATVVEIDTYSSPYARKWGATTLVDFDPAGEQLWRREAPDADSGLSIVIGDTQHSGVPQVFGGVFVLRDRNAIHISDGSDAWQPGESVALASNNRQAVREGFLYGGTKTDGEWVVSAIDARDGSIILGPLGANQLEQGAAAFLSHTSLPTGDVFAQTPSIRPAETVMFGLPTTVE
ncbi:hypothetical protein [Nocardiopsis sp. MG754419]|uniref:hypothetical protein n=1 Tax=Nocardiopsis sp. MG754419 TaxID=2259865 RepID=UPI001BA9B0C7|nr:hypothetical protein [Nocardiopsis sp. MG754419]